MALFKCKMCGGGLNVSEGMTVCKCEYCGTKQTLPKLDDEKKITLYERASHFRRNNEFDKAAGFYETILAEDKTDAEAYWSLVLCRYGIEYVEDPSTHKRIPTVNRAQYTSVLIDEDYQSAMKYADGYQRDVYEAEANAIDEIQKGILEISNKEEPFDVFICYKETNSNGSRTKDSVCAQEIYEALTKEGYRVFFSRITLEDKLGTAYEPYIFAALNSSKVMIPVGTSRSNLNSVWVKNEWSRYLALIKAGEEKNIIPVYCDMDAYDLPDEFSYLQSQDRNKVGFMQDLVRGVKKLISQDVIDTRQKAGTTSVIIDTMMNRATIALAKKEWETAIRCFDSVLDYDDKNANAYLGKLMANNEINAQEKLADIETPLENDDNYLKAVEFADDSLKEKLKEYNSKTIENAANIIKEKQKKKKKIFAGIIVIIIIIIFAFCGYLLVENYFIPLKTYNSAIALVNNKDYDEAIKIFEKLNGYKDSEEQIIETHYLKGIDLYESKKYKDAISVFGKVSLGYKDRDKYVEECQKLQKSTEEKERYQSGIDYYKKSRYEQAAMVFEALGDYKDSKEKALDSKYEYIKMHKDDENICNDSNFYSYITDLIDLNYKDLKSIYDSVYSWRFKVFVNNSNDGTNSMSSINKNDSVYVHVKAISGPYDENKNLHLIVYNNEYNTIELEHSGSVSPGNEEVFSYGYQTPSAVTEKSSYTAKVYDSDTNEFIGQVNYMC